MLLEEYLTLGEFGSRGIGMRTADGFIQLLGAGAEGFRDSAASTVAAYRGSGRGGGGRVPFDEAERRQVANATSNAERRAQLPGGGTYADSYLGMSTSGAPGDDTGSAPRTPAGMQAPVRVGSNLRTPRRVTHVPPVYPERARTLGIGGMVILEIVIGTDGRVTSAKVLRSIEMLDAAAIEAVRQWRYEPTLINDVPGPVVMTATVSFP